MPPSSVASRAEELCLSIISAIEDEDKNYTAEEVGIALTIVKELIPPDLWEEIAKVD